VIEAETLAQVREFLNLEVDRILLDNFSIAQLKLALALRKRMGKKIPFEVSGGITLKTIKGYALPGIDFISVGSLTHSAPALDLSLRITRV
jgi:nicotinate-nucleotide pyrophosphorylase (carboxylating)